MVTSSEKISLETWADWLNLRENAFVTAAHKFIDSNQSTEKFDISDLLEMISDESSDDYRIVKDTFGENSDVLVDIIDQTKNAFQEFQSEYLLIQHLYRIYKQKRDLYKISMEENSKVMRGKLYKEMREPFKTVCGKMADYQENNNISLSNETMLDLLDEIVVSPRLKYEIQAIVKAKPIVDMDIHQLMIETILPSYGLRNDSYQLQRNRQLWSDKYPTKVSNFLEELSDVDQLLFEIVNKYIDRSMAITVDHLDNKQKITALELIRLCQQLMLDIKRRHPMNHDHRSDLVFREDIKKSLANISKLATKGNLDHIDEHEILFQCESCIWDSSSDNWKWTINTLMALFLIGSIAICYINPPIGIGLTILVLAIAYKIKSNRDSIKQKPSM